MKKQQQQTTVTNACGIEIRRWCGSCQHKCVPNSGQRKCQLEEKEKNVKQTDVCDAWLMAEGFEKVRMSQGKIKSRAYLMFVQVMRREEAEAIEQGILLEEDCKTNEELRAMYEKEFGNIYIN